METLLISEMLIIILVAFVSAVMGGFIGGVTLIFAIRAIPGMMFNMMSGMMANRFGGKEGEGASPMDC